MKKETQKEKTPAKVFHPGEILLDELNDRQLTQAEFASIIDRPARTVNEIIKGKRGITPETAGVIGAALNTTPDMWLSMQSEYDLFLVNKKTESKNQEVRERSELYNLFPIADLIRRKYITSRKKVDELRESLFTLLEINSIDEFKEQDLVLLRASEGNIVFSYIRAWILLGKKAAKNLKDIVDYNEVKLIEVAKEIKNHSRDGEGAIATVIEKLNSAGVRIIMLPHFSKTKVDGATCWIDEKKPLIILSMRYDRIDNFYFTLLHEIGHILLHKNEEKNEFIDVDIYSPTENPKEKEANEFALKSLGFENLASELKYSELTPQLILRKSEQIGVHPGLLVGHLQHSGLIEYSVYRKALVKVRSTIPANVVQN